VQGFSLAPATKQYLSQISSLSGKKAACFITKQLKANWMGGTKAIRQITAACNGKGADISLSGIICWSSEDREAQIEDVVRRLSTI